MHRWIVTAKPWPGVRAVQCIECGLQEMLVGKQIPQFLGILNNTPSRHVDMPASVQEEKGPQVGAVGRAEPTLVAG